MKYFSYIISSTLFVVILLSSCSTTQRHYKSVSFLDYSIFNKSGVFVTESNSAPFDYEAIGRIFITELSGYKRGKEVKSKIQDPYSEKKYEETYIGANYENMCSEMCDKIKSIGGDGIINFSIIEIPATTQNGSGIRLTGMVVKRK
ncbi:MAG: hypothetical protein RSH25_15700 [Bacteroides sp.]|uniref:hypothetical protein n=1 Tax=Bacteroides sp. TaxID=29523 RepID=UPI002FC65DD1